MGLGLDPNPGNDLVDIVRNVKCNFPLPSTTQTHRSIIGWVVSKARLGRAAHTYVKQFVEFYTLLLFALCRCDYRK